MHKIILSVSGHPSSGKDTVAKYIAEHYGFTNWSGGDALRKYIRENNLGEPTREMLSEISIQLRKKRGPDFLTRMALETETPRLLVSGTRTVAEAESLKAHGGILIAVTAPREMRYERAKARGRIGDNVSFEQFTTIEEQEARGKDIFSQSVDDVIAMADYTIENTGTLPDLHVKTEELLKTLNIQKPELHKNINKVS